MKGHDGRGPRVVWVVHRFTSGGIGPVCIYAARELARRYGWRTTVVALHEPKGSGQETYREPRMVALDLPEHDTTGFVKWLSAHPQEVVITNDVETVAPCMQHFPKGTLHVIQVHDSGARYIAAAVRNSPFADGIICVANYFTGKVRQAVSRNRFNGSIATVHNGADFPLMPQRCRHAGQLRILYMGRMDPLVKGTFDLADILKATARMGADFRLSIAGGTCPRLEARFTRFGLSDRVKWLGRIPHEQCYEIAAESDILMMTSRKEPFGMVTIEAMSMGCVPIAWDIESGTREIIVAGESGLLAPIGNTDSFAAAIASLNNDRELLLRMGRAASERVRTRFRSEDMAASLEQFLGGLTPWEGRSFSTGQTKLMDARTSHTSPPPRRIMGFVRDLIRRFLEERPKAAAWALKHFI